MNPVYLDYNATTPVDPEVAEAMQPALESVFGNPSSQHAFGLEAKKMVETARRRVAGLLGCRKEEIIFTSGGTESNNHAIKGAALAQSGRGRHIITSKIEHPSVLEVCRHLQKEGFEVTYLPVDAEGRIKPEDLEKAIRPDTVLISIMHANNETGTIQPLEEISRIARPRNIYLHTDAAQSAGKIPCLVNELGVDLLSLAGHKMHGPKGIGGLYIREGTRIEKFMHGADHEENRRAGTENVPEIAGMGKAAEQAAGNLTRNQEVMRSTRDLLWDELSSSLPGIRRNGSPGHCLPNTLSVTFPGTDARTILSELEGVAASTGAACHTGEKHISHVLEAMGLDASDALGTIRFSTGRNTTREEIRKASELIRESVLPLMQEIVPGAKKEKSRIKLTRFTHGMGCACKLRPQDLEKILARLPLPDDPDILVDARDSDDATVWRMDENTAWVQSVDFFTPVVDDPYTFGRIAAANALSDIYAMGARPLFGLNIVAFPAKRLPLEVLDEVLEGARSIALEAGIRILGGHSIEDNEIKFGMVVSGTVHPGKIIRNSGALPGDSILLTKALGTGVLSTALKRGALTDREYRELIDSMTALNKTASETMSAYPVHACTDVTGFGLLGHLLEMLRASDVAAAIAADRVPVLNGVMEHIAAGIYPGGSLQNLDHIKPHTRWEGPVHQDMKKALADAQTSGGLLIALPEKDAGGLLKDLKKAGCTTAARIGNVSVKSDNTMYIRVLERKN